MWWMLSSLARGRRDPEILDGRWTLTGDLLLDVFDRFFGLFEVVCCEPDLDGTVS